MIASRILPNASSTTAAPSISPIPVAPALRTDATPCNPNIDSEDIDAALAEGVRHGCISEVIEQGFPRYVWAWLGGDLYEARHLNGFAGKYKGYRLETPEYPRDPDGRLDWSLP